jgi:hypothetical protein
MTMMTKEHPTHTQVSGKKRISLFEKTLPTSVIEDGAILLNGGARDGFPTVQIHKFVLDNKTKSMLIDNR